MNLGANICDKDKPFFWSRKWADMDFNPNSVEWAFPLLYVFDMSANVENVFTGKTKAVHNLQIGVIDVLSEDCAAGNCAGCNGRTVNEIHIDTQRMLINALRFTGGFVYGNDFDGEIPSGFYHEAHLQKMVTDGVIPAGERTVKLMQTSFPKNKEMTFIHIERPTDRMFGTATELRLETSACMEPFNDFTDINWGVVPQNVGCQNCD